MEMKYVLATIVCILIAQIKFAKCGETNENKDHKKSFGLFSHPFSNFFNLHAGLYKGKEDDDSEDEDDSDEYSYPRNICPTQSFFPVEKSCKKGSVKDKDKNCDTRDCLFFPTVGYTVRPSYFDLFNIPQYYRYMFSKQIVNPSPYSFYGGLGSQQSFQSPAIANPFFPQQHGFQQQQYGSFHQIPQQFANQQFPQFHGQNPNPYPYNQQPILPSGYNPYPQAGYQPSVPPGNSGLGQNFPPPGGVFAQESPIIPAPPRPPPPPPPPPPPSNAGSGARSLFFSFLGQNSGFPNHPSSQQKPGASSFPFQQNPYGTAGFGAVNPSHSSMGPIIAKFCRSPGKVCQCETEEECECDAKRPKVCTQEYVDDARFFWVYEWVKHTAAQPNQHNPHQPNQQQPNQHGVIAPHESGFQNPIVKSGQRATEHQGYNPYPQNGQVDYSQPVQPVQSTGSYQLRRRFLYFQRANGCKCQVRKPGQFPSFGFFS